MGSFKDDECARVMSRLEELTARNYGENDEEMLMLLKVMVMKMSKLKLFFTKKKR